MTKKRLSISILVVVSMVLTIFIATTSFSHGATKTYWLKVNTQRNVVTAYEKSGSTWKPVRAMLCSSGLSSTPTPRGTFYTKGKWNWGAMMNDVYAQYCTHITGEVLFHSVYYNSRGKRASQPTWEFNRLGSNASHGCVRLSTMDAKWIYNNCKVGTKVTIYRSSYAGPLGKPSANKVYTGRYLYWDPTDSSKSNPYFIMKRPVIKVSSKKARTIREGTSYNLKSYVSAKDPNTNMNITSYLKVSKVKKYSSKKKKYLTAKFTTKSTGTYQITYYVKDPYGRSQSKTLKIKVVHDLRAPAIKASNARNVTVGSTNALSGVSASQSNLSRTKAITTYIKAPGSSSYVKYNYTDAIKYKFTKTGQYTVKYTVKNAYKPYRGASKTVVIKSYAEPSITVTNQTINAPASIDMSKINITHASGNLTSRLLAYVTTPSGKTSSAMSYSQLKSYQFTVDGKYTVKIYIKNPYSPYTYTYKAFTVTAANPPVITAPNQNVTEGETLDPLLIKVTHYTGDLTSSITAVITKVDDEIEQTVSYDQLMSYTFDKAGEYTIVLSVVNPYAAGNNITKTIKVTCTSSSDDNTPGNGE